MSARYPEVPPATEVLPTDDPNSAQVEAFLRGLAPDLVIARCKRLLKKRIFSIPRCGTFVLHPGICPEYRNAHSAFWAVALGDREGVGLTLLKVDAGVDTGPVYGYYSCAFDEQQESHIVIMIRLVLENLDRVRRTLLEIHEGRAVPIDVTGRSSAAWGHPWLTTFARWKLGVGRRRARAVA
jgi:methionyl-tRNA formyltransferase